MRHPMEDREKLFHRNLIDSWKDYIVEYHCVLLLWKGFKIDEVMDVTGLDRSVVGEYQQKIERLQNLAGNLADVLGPSPSQVWNRAQLLRYMRERKVRKVRNAGVG